MLKSPSMHPQLGETLWISKSALPAFFILNVHRSALPGLTLPKLWTYSSTTNLGIALSVLELPCLGGLS